MRMIIVGVILFFNCMLLASSIKCVFNKQCMVKNTSIPFIMYDFIENSQITDKMMSSIRNKCLKSIKNSHGCDVTEIYYNGGFFSFNKKIKLSSSCYEIFPEIKSLYKKNKDIFSTRDFCSPETLQKIAKTRLNQKDLNDFNDFYNSFLFFNPHLSIYESFNSEVGKVPTLFNVNGQRPYDGYKEAMKYLDKFSNHDKESQSWFRRIFKRDKMRGLDDAMYSLDTLKNIQRFLMSKDSVKNNNSFENSQNSEGIGDEDIGHVRDMYVDFSIGRGDTTGEEKITLLNRKPILKDPIPYSKINTINEYLMYHESPGIDKVQYPNPKRPDLITNKVWFSKLSENVQNKIRGKDQNKDLSKDEYQEVIEDLTTKVLVDLKNKIKKETDKKKIIDAVSDFYRDFLSIHPFSDGNGRVARSFIQKIFLDKNIAPPFFLYWNMDLALTKNGFRKLMYDSIVAANEVNNSLCQDLSKGKPWRDSFNVAPLLGLDSPMRLKDFSNLVKENRLQYNVPNSEENGEEIIEKRIRSIAGILGRSMKMDNSLSTHLLPNDTDSIKRYKIDRFLERIATPLEKDLVTYSWLERTTANEFIDNGIVPHDVVNKHGPISPQQAIMGNGLYVSLSNDSSEYAVPDGVLLKVVLKKGQKILDLTDPKIKGILSADGISAIDLAHATPQIAINYSDSKAWMVLKQVNSKRTHSLEIKQADSSDFSVYEILYKMGTSATDVSKEYFYKMLDFNKKKILKNDLEAQGQEYYFSYKDTKSNTVVCRKTNSINTPSEDDLVSFNKCLIYYEEETVSDGFKQCFLQYRSKKNKNLILPISEKSGQNCNHPPGLKGKEFPSLQMSLNEKFVFDNYIYKVNDDKYRVITSFDENSDTFKIEEVVGLKEAINKSKQVSKKFGIDQRISSIMSDINTIRSKITSKNVLNDGLLYLVGVLDRDAYNEMDIKKAIFSKNEFDTNAPYQISVHSIPQESIEGAATELQKLGAYKTGKRLPYHFLYENVEIVLDKK